MKTLLFSLPSVHAYRRTKQIDRKLADLAVLSQDIFTVPAPELPKTRSVLTLVGGRAVCDAKVLEVK